MAIQVLRPQRLERSDYSGVERALISFMQRFVFGPVWDVLSEQMDARELSNSAPQQFDRLAEALMTGRVEYAEGVFTGSFDRYLTGTLLELGAKFRRRQASYYLDPALVPDWVKAAAAQFAASADALHDRLGRKLDDIVKTLDEKAETLEVPASETVAKLDAGLRAGAKTREGVGVVPELTADAQRALAETYTDAMRMEVKSLAREAVEELRAEVMANAEQGGRAEGLIRRITERSKVSKSRAQFLARQETSLFMAQHRRRRFGDVGITRYRWRTTGTLKVRPAHRALNGQIFFYADPPIVDPTTGRRGNPGEDYGCQCVDEPILGPVEVFE